MSCRSFTATGEANRLAQDMKDKILALDDAGQLLERQREPWDPRNQLAILDGLEAAKWAWIFLEMAAEPYICEYIEFFVKQTRLRPSKLDAVKKLWDSAGWRVALAMRSNASFREATAQVMQDSGFINDCIQATQPVTPPRPTRREPTGAVKQASPRFTAGPYTQPQVCQNFLRGTCRMAEKCRYRHVNSEPSKKGKGKGKKGKGRTTPTPAAE